jgi:inner membrane protein
MDPVTQGILGASVPQAISQKNNIVYASLLGAVSGMAPDLDTFITSDNDPLLYLEYHRQFTHSLLFIPIGALICALVFYYLFSRRLEFSFKLTYIFCLCGYATHGLLDACTSYGTQLLWPFSTERFASNTISVIDPLFTLPLLALVLIGLKKKNPTFAQFALAWVIVYQGLGLYQHQRVAGVGAQLAQQRGHTPIRMEVKPSFANLLLWKIIYEVEDGFRTDAVRAALSITVYPGNLVPKLDIERDLPWLDKTSQQATDLARFNWFSKGYLSLDPNNPHRVTDIRYSLVPNESTGMWSIWFDPNANRTQHVTMKQDRDMSTSRRKKFSQMILNIN